MPTVPSGNVHPLRPWTFGRVASSAAVPPEYQIGVSRAMIRLTFSYRALRSSKSTVVIAS